MALATCKVCMKAICLMCVHEEKDGTFCSEACIHNLREVNDWVGTGSAPPPQEAAAQPQPVAAAVEAPPASSVFEEMPEHVAEVSHPDPVAIPEQSPAESEPPPPEAPAPSTNSIGNPCFAHPDIRAKAFCRRCRKPICGLCIIENAAGMFCSDACVSQSRSKTKLGAGAKAAVAVFVLAALGAGAYAVKPELFKGLLGTAAPEKKKPDPKPPKPEVPKPEVPKPEVPKPPKPEPPKPEVPKPEIPKPPKPEPPKPEVPKPEVPLPPPPPRPERPKPTIMVHPWSSDEPGTWYRVRRGDLLEDIGLKDRDPVSYTINVQTWSNGQARPATQAMMEVVPIEILGEESVEIEGRTYLCQVRRQKDRREWTLVTGRHAGAVLRAESPEASQEAVRVWEHEVRMGDRSFDCLVVESRHSEGRMIKSWYCPTYPLKIVRLERDGVLVEALVEWGSAWASRKPPK
jgi:hypothetical protein